MPPDNWIDNRMPGVQIALGVVGMVAFCFYARSWRDIPHLIYDIPASFAVFAFVGQVVLELCLSGPTPYVLARLGLIAALTIVCGGRDFFAWSISGHLTCVLAVALLQSFDARLPLLERAAYWIPLPIVLVIRWTTFDKGDHAQTYYAILFAVLAAAITLWLGRLPVAGPGR